MLRTVTLIAVLLLLSASKAAASLNNGDASPDDLPIAKLDQLLDKVEHAGTVMLRYTRKYRQAIKGVAGAMIFMYGANFPASLLMYQAVGATGLPGMKKNLQELFLTYKATRSTFKDEMPQIAKARVALDEALALKSDLEKRLREAEEQYRSGDLSKEQFRAVADEVKHELQVAKKQMKQLSEVSSSLKRIYAAVNPDHLKGVLSSIYVSVLSVVAAASNQVLAKATIGLQIGRALAERISEIITEQGSKWFEKHGESLQSKHDSSMSVVLDQFMDSNAAWVQNAVTAASTIAGFIVTHMFKKAMFVFSSCTTGAKMMLESCAAVVDPVLAEMGMPTLASGSKSTAVLQTSLVAIGVYMNLTGAGKVPLLLKVVFAPLYALEIGFRSLFPSSLLGGPGV